MNTKIELPVSELKTALTGLGKVVLKRSTLPVLQSIRVARDNMGIVRLQGTDLDSWATYKLPVAQEGDPVAFLVPLETLSRPLKTTKDRVVLYPEGKDSVVIQSFLGNTPLEQKVASVDPKDWPNAPLILSRSVLLDDATRSTLKEAWECASADQTRYVLNSVYLDVQDPKAHYMVATNGRALYSANSFTFDLKESLMIPTRKFLGWGGWWTCGNALLNTKPAGPAKTPNEVDQPGWIQFSTEQWTFATKQIEGEYPNWKQVIPQTAPRTILRIPESALPTLLELIARLPGSEAPDQAITLHVTDRKLFLEGRSQDQDPAASVPVTEVVVEGDPVRVSLNRSYLEQALRFGLREIHLIDELSALLIKTGGKKMVIMPLRPAGPTPVANSSMAEASPEGPAAQASSQLDQAPEQTQPAAGAPPSVPQQSSPVTQSTTTTKPTNERNKTMITSEITPPAATITPERTPRNNGEAATEKSCTLKGVLEEAESLKSALRAVLRQINEITTLVKAAEREQRLSEREFESVRTTLRSLQRVSL